MSLMQSTGPDRFFYEVVRGSLLAGQYPSDLDPKVAAAKLEVLTGLGVQVFINLMEPQEKNYDGIEFDSYEPLIREIAARRGIKVEFARFPIRDLDVPSPDTMRQILDQIHSANARRQIVYVHCRGGIGRTGTVVGCYLVEEGLSPAEALAQIPLLRRGLRACTSPETAPQRQFVTDWSRHAFGPRT